MFITTKAPAATVPLTVAMLAFGKNIKKKLIKGKRGGTYYVSDSGKKVYVDDALSPVKRRSSNVKKQLSKDAKKIQSIIARHYDCKDILDRTGSCPKMKHAAKTAAKYGKIASRLLMTYRGYALALTLDGVSTAINKGVEKSARLTKKMGLKKVSRSLKTASKTTNKINKVLRDNRKSFDDFVFGKD